MATEVPAQLLVEGEYTYTGLRSMSENTRRDESGRFESELRDEDIVGYFAEGRPFHTAGEVADRFDVDRSTAYRRLSKLEDDGSLEKISLGSRTVVWWYTDATETDAEEIDSTDPLFSAPVTAIGESVDEDEIDDILYGEIDG
jgi:DNA-binding FadR family transcriptional regulator